jgi:ParB/Sulfiredoxin domain
VAEPSSEVAALADQLSASCRNVLKGHQVLGDAEKLQALLTYSEHDQAKIARRLILACDWDQALQELDPAASVSPDESAVSRPEEPGSAEDVESAPASSQSPDDAKQSDSARVPAEPVPPAAEGGDATPAGPPEEVAGAARLEERSVDALRPNPVNAEVFSESLDDASIEALAGNIQRHGLRCPIEVAADDTIVDGERRWRAVRLLGWLTVPVNVVMDSPDREDVEEYVFDAFSSNRDASLRERVRLFSLATSVLTRRHGRGRGRPSGKDPQLEDLFWDPEQIRSVAARRAGFTSYELARRAAKVVEHGHPGVITQIEAGAVSVSRAYADLAKAAGSDAASAKGHANDGASDASEQFGVPSTHDPVVEAVSGGDATGRDEPSGTTMPEPKAVASGDDAPLPANAQRASQEPNELEAQAACSANEEPQPNGPESAYLDEQQEEEPEQRERVSVADVVDLIDRLLSHCRDDQARLDALVKVAQAVDEQAQGLRRSLDGDDDDYDGANEDRKRDDDYEREGDPSDDEVQAALVALLENRQPTEDEAVLRFLDGEPEEP